MLLRKQYVIIFLFGLAVAISVAAIKKDVDNYLGAQFIPPSSQRSGDAQKGYDYVVTGDYLKSGLGYQYYILGNGKDKNNLLERTGKNATVPYSFNVIKTTNNLDIVVPNCLQCHGEMFEGKLVVGLGNTTIDFSNVHKTDGLLGKMATRLMQTFSPKQFEAASGMLRSFSSVYPFLKTEVRGVNAADRLAILLVAHRNPETLEWNDEALLNFPQEVVPTDVPAWWLLKKKNAMFYNGFGRGDFGKFLMLSNLLTVKDTTEARETSTHFGDVLAFLKTIEPPKYPRPINNTLAAKGKQVYTVTCSKCHGTYGDGGQYPNLLIAERIIQTDSMLFKANYQNPQFIEWFNKSWYAKGDHPAKLQPFDGYIAPPLDGVWVTAPYLHNGSVPTLEALLNSSKRPRYWQRDFTNPQYDYTQVGWTYTTKTKPAKKTYNTDLEGYRNTGHNFGDNLTNDERKAVIEYLKTL